MGPSRTRGKDSPPHECRDRSGHTGGSDEPEPQVHKPWSVDPFETFLDGWDAHFVL
jgi:hypothetical protein